LRRQRTAQTFAPELEHLLDSEWTLAPAVAELFGANVIKDDLLRMMFSCCHPQLSEAAQVALILNILCGFSVGEIASAFVSSHAAIAKRIARAKKTLAGSKRLFDIAVPADFSVRLLPSIARSTSCSMRAITALLPSRRSARGSAVKRCGLRRFCWTIHWGQCLRLMRCAP